MIYPKLISMLTWGIKTVYCISATFLVIPVHVGMRRLSNEDLEDVERLIAIR